MRTNWNEGAAGNGEHQAGPQCFRWSAQAMGGWVEGGAECLCPVQPPQEPLSEPRAPETSGNEGVS